MKQIAARIPKMDAVSMFLLACILAVLLLLLM
jgi:hypothetical protein